MHAGTPSAVGAHALLCVALACVMSARTFVDACAGRARSSSRRDVVARAAIACGVLCAFASSYWTLARAGGDAVMARAPGTLAHVLWTLAPSNAMYALAMAARGDVRGRGLGTLASGAAAGVVGAATGRRRAGRAATLCAGVATTARGDGDWRACAMAVVWCVALGLCVREGEEVYFVNWAGTVACETAALAMVKFGDAATREDEGEGRDGRRGETKKTR